MKILFILENYPPHYGGVEVLFKNLCEGLARRGHTVTVLTRQLPNTLANEVVNGVNIVRVRSLNSRYWFTFCSIPKAVSLAKEYDIIHTTTFNAAPVAWLAAKLRRKPAVLTVHEVWQGKWSEFTSFSPLNAWVHELLERPIYWLKFTRYVCVSKFTQKRLLEVKKGLSKKEVSVIHNGFDKAMWTPQQHAKKAMSIRENWNATKDIFVVLGYGRPGPSKGFEFLIRGFAEFVNRQEKQTTVKKNKKDKKNKKKAKGSKEINKNKLVLILSSDKQFSQELTRLKELTVDLKIEDKVLFLPGQPYSELPAFLVAANCIVIPSLSEGFGFTTVESCASGTPVVASKVGSIPEVISGKYAFSKPKDPISIAEGIDMVKSEKFTVTDEKSFSWEKTVSLTEELHKKILEKETSEKW